MGGKGECINCVCVAVVVGTATASHCQVEWRMVVEYMFLLTLTFGDGRMMVDAVDFIPGKSSPN